MKTKELTYQNWLEGKFELDSVYRFTDESNNLHSPIVSRKSIQEDQLKLINEAQSKLFNKLVEDRTKVLLDDFNKRYTESEFPDTTIRIEANRIIAYIRGKRNNFSSEDVVIEKIGELVPKEFNKNHHNYINRRVNGFPKEFHFVPSPKSDYYDYMKYVLPEVYAESLINLYHHISKFDSSIEPERLFTDPYQSLFKDEPLNDFPDIFSSGYGYSLFIQIEEAIIIPEQTPKPGDYALIYKMLFHDTVGVIRQGVSFEKFFSFLMESRNIELNKKSNKPSFKDLKLNVIRFFLRRYFYQTRTIDENEIEKLVQNVIEQKAT